MPAWTRSTRRISSVAYAVDEIASEANTAGRPAWQPLVVLLGGRDRRPMRSRLAIETTTLTPMRPRGPAPTSRPCCGRYSRRALRANADWLCSHCVFHGVTNSGMTTVMMSSGFSASSSSR